MCATAILPKMKKDERPERDSSQVKMLLPPSLSKFMNAKHPKRSWSKVTARGRPFLSTYAKSFGPIPVVD